MDAINVEGLPVQVVRSLENLVDGLKKQFTSTQEPSPGEGLRQAAGGWADADEHEFNTWLEETYRARKQDRAESPT